MKKTKLLLLLCGIPTVLAGCGNSDNTGTRFWSVLLVILSLALLALAGLRTYSIIQYNQRRNRGGRKDVPERSTP